MIQVSTASAPRVIKSWATAVSRSAFRATSMKCRFGAASLRRVAIAMLEVAPKTNTREGKRGSRSGTAGYPLPEAGAERGIDVGGPLLPLGIELLKMGRAHAGILRRIHASAEVGRDAGEAVQRSKLTSRRTGKSSARVMPGTGNDITPGETASPKTLMTARNDASRMQ